MGMVIKPGLAVDRVFVERRRSGIGRKVKPECGEAPKRRGLVIGGESRRRERMKV